MLSSDYRDLALRLRERRALALQAAAKAEANVAQATAQAAATAGALALAQLTAQTVQAAAHARLAGLVSEALAAVFDDPYELRINFVQRRGRTEADIVLVRDGQEIDPMEAAGGGVVDVAAFALRLTALVMQRGNVRQLLVLDEPFRFVSRNYLPRVRELLLALAERLGVQIIMVTHIPELMCGEVVELTRGQGDGLQEPQ